MANHRVSRRRMRRTSSPQAEFKRLVEELFEYARETCALCGVEIAIVVYSPEGEAFTFGHPSVEAVVERFSGKGSDTASNADSTLTETNMEVSSLAPRAGGEEAVVEEQKLMSSRKGSIP